MEPLRWNRKNASISLTTSREAALSCIKSNACGAIWMVHEGNRKVAGQCSGHKLVQRPIQSGKLILTRSRNEQWNISREIVYSLPRTAIDEPVLPGRLRYSRPSVEVHGKSIAQHCASQLISGLLHQGGQGRWNIPGTGPQPN